MGEGTYFPKITLLRLATFAANLPILAKGQDQQSGNNETRHLIPQLNGEHFRITAIREPGFVDFQAGARSDKDGNSSSEYFMDILKLLSQRANFTYELLSPSGYGSLCVPQLSMNNTTFAYSEHYTSQYNCGQADVTDLPRHGNYSTDMYWGAYYLTPPRQLVSYMSIPIRPPKTQALTMVGTLTRVSQISQVPEHEPVCVSQAAAYTAFLRESFPHMHMIEIPGSDESVYQAMQSGLCQVFVSPYSSATNFVQNRLIRGQCKIQGKPIGIVGEPLNFGYSDFAVGVGRHLPPTVIEIINYWLNVFMTCSPLDLQAPCLGNSLAALFDPTGLQATTGQECGYVNFPRDDEHERLLSVGATAAISVGTAVVLVLALTAWYLHRLKVQRNRFRKRFVQQIARNIEIGPSPGSIPAQTLADQVQHIGNEDGVITKEKLLNWMNDVKMSFISEKDFNALWAAMDADGTGTVDPVEFFVFLSGCGSQFEQVYNEQMRLPKNERLKLAVRRLTNLQELGEEGVRRAENRMDRVARIEKPGSSQFSTKGSCEGSSSSANDPSVILPLGRKTRRSGIGRNGI